MSGDVQLELWLHEYKMEALSAVLEQQGTSVEKQMQEMLVQLYAENVPQEVQRGIRQRIDDEYAAELAEREAARKYSAFQVRESGKDRFYQLDQGEGFLDVGRFLRRYSQTDQELTAASLEKSFADLKPITAKQYELLAVRRMEDPGKVTGVFRLDFDEMTAAALDPAEGWKAYSIKDVSTAVYHAYRKNGLAPERYEARFEERLVGRQLDLAAFEQAVPEIDALEHDSEQGPMLSL